MKKNFVYVMLIVLFVSASICSGCGGAASTSAPKDPKELGAKISNDYFEMMGELKSMVASKPAPEELSPKLKTLKDKYIEKFVAYGKQRQALSDQDKMAVNTSQMQTTSEKQSKDSSLTNLNWLNEAASHYTKLDSKLGSELSSMAILTQYSDFDLLKKQNAAEAQRLGIQ
jgi:hypothetical protein